MGPLVAYSAIGNDRVESYTLLKQVCDRTLGRWCLKRAAGEDLVGTFPSFLSSSSLGEAGPAREPHEVTGRYVVLRALPQSQETHLSKLVYFLQLKGPRGGNSIGK